jgi:thiol-disulfide isomerase/thioredoxin
MIDAAISFVKKNLTMVVIGLVVAVALYGFMRRRGIAGFQNPSGGASPVSENTFTMYYADWCPHCQSAKPEFKELAAKGYVGEGGARCKIKMVGLEENPEEMKAAGGKIKGFPTFLLETPGGQTYEYQGERNTDGYLKFINEKLGGGI